MAGKEANIVVVDKSGNTILQVDENGMQDAAGYAAYHQVSSELLAASVDKFVFVNAHPTHKWKVVAVRAKCSVVGGSGATVDVKKVPAATAVASGTTQLTAALDLTVTAPSDLPGTLIASPSIIYPGDSIGLDFSGTLTGLVGVITIVLGRLPN